MRWLQGSRHARKTCRVLGPGSVFADLGSEQVAAVFNFT